MELGAELPLLDSKTRMYHYTRNHDSPWDDKIPILDLDLENVDLADLAEGKVCFVSLLNYNAYKLTD